MTDSEGIEGIREIWKVICDYREVNANKEYDNNMHFIGTIQGMLEEFMEDDTCTDDGEGE